MRFSPILNGGRQLYYLPTEMASRAITLFDLPDEILDLVLSFAATDRLVLRAVCRFLRARIDGALRFFFRDIPVLSLYGIGRRGDFALLCWVLGDDRPHAGVEWPQLVAALSGAARGGHAEIVRRYVLNPWVRCWLVPSGPFDREHLEISDAAGRIVLHASWGGDEQLAAWVGRELRVSGVAALTLAGAAAAGRLADMRRLYGACQTDLGFAADAAAKEGQVEALRLCHELWGGTAAYWMDGGQVVAAASDQAELLAELRGWGGTLQDPFDLACAAARQGCLKTLAVCHTWAAAEFGWNPHSINPILEEAAEWGQLDAVLWCHAAGATDFQAALCRGATGRSDASRANRASDTVDPPGALARRKLKIMDLCRKWGAANFGEAACVAAGSGFRAARARAHGGGDAAV